MKLLSRIVLFLAFFAACHAASGQVNKLIYTFKVDTNELYYLTCNGVRITQSVYEQGNDDFIANRAMVKRNGKFGYINPKGEEVIAPKYDNATSFSSANKAVVFYDCKTAIIDTLGALTFLEKEYHYVNRFMGNFAIVNDARFNYGLINAQGKEVIKPLYNSLGDFEHGYARFSDTLTRLSGIIDTAGTIIIPARYFSIYKHDLFFTTKEKIKRKKILEGLANYKGKIIVPAMYTDINFSYENLAKADVKPTLIIATNTTFNQLRRYYFSRSTNDESRRVKKVDIYTSNGELLFSDKGKYWRNLGGQVVFSSTKAGLKMVNINKESFTYKGFVLNQLNPIINKYYLIYKKPKNRFDFYTRPALIDSLGRLALDTVYSSIHQGKWGGANCIIAQKGDTSTFFDASLNVIIRVPYTNLHSNNYSINGVKKQIYIARIGKLSCILNDKLNVLFPSKYSYITMGDNMFIVSQDNKMGIIDSNFKEVFAPQYDYLTYHSYYDIFRITVGKKEGIALSNGKVVLPPVYDEIDATDNNWYRYDIVKERPLFYITKKDKRYGLADSTGKTILNNSYKYIDYRAGRLEVSDKIKIGYFSKSLKQLTPNIYDKVRYDYNPDNDYRYFVVKQGKKYGLLDSLGHKVFNTEYQSVSPMYSHNKVILKKNKKKGVFTFGKETVIPMEYDGIYFEDKYFYVRKKKLYGVFNIQGKEVIPCNYIYIQDWGENLFLLVNKVGKRTKYGIANERGKIIVPVAYDYYNLDYSNSTIIVSVDAKKYFYNSEGEPTNDCYIDKYIR